MSLELILLSLLDQPASGYDLKREFEAGAATFWPAQLSQVYPTLKRLEARSLSASELARGVKFSRERKLAPPQAAGGVAAVAGRERSEPVPQPRSGTSYGFVATLGRLAPRSEVAAAQRARRGVSDMR